jgi:hypothetical protein
MGLNSMAVEACGWSGEESPPVRDTMKEERISQHTLIILISTYKYIYNS